jgi:hypothetical protein
MVVRPRMGMQKLLTVERALVSWTLDETITPEAVRLLPGDVVDQIFEHVRIPGRPGGEDADQTPLAATSVSNGKRSGASVAKAS